MKLIDILINDEIITEDQVKIMFDAYLRTKDFELGEILNSKVKYYFQFNFLKSAYFKNWMKDPIKISSSKANKIIHFSLDKNKKKIMNSSKNIFKNQPEDYEKYKMLLLHTACNFIFYFQNNPLKFGKKKNNLTNDSK